MRTADSWSDSAFDAWRGATEILVNEFADYAKRDDYLYARARLQSLSEAVMQAFDMIDGREGTAQPASLS
ncbi:MAG TPA: hypothetical protein DGG94_06405 [Micromonosporaceae bacterium]|nr:hypothetical protein [Micromonosporaceae bacterium]HCU49423.1 hypothetical protein [Micromonosporaceae bacterium]